LHPVRGKAAREKKRAQTSRHFQVRVREMWGKKAVKPPTKGNGVKKIQQTEKLTEQWWGGGFFMLEIKTWHMGKHSSADKRGEQGGLCPARAP